MRSDYCPIANEPCQCMCLGDCQLRRPKPAGDDHMRVYRAIASNYEAEKTRMTNITIPRALLEQALDALQAHADIGINAEKAITSLRSALEQPQQEDSDLLAAYEGKT